MRINPATTGCGGVVTLLLLNLLVGGWSVHTILGWFGKNIPFMADTLIGFFVAELSFPIAIVGSILKVFGVF